jgi:multicomponent Na+:H+ antiporter subunit F
MAQVRQTILIAGAAALAILILVTLVRAILGPRFTDRIVAVNMINTMVVALICILSVYLREDFLVDVALAYALLSFLTVVVLSKMVITRHRIRRMKQKKAEGGDLHGT